MTATAHAISPDSGTHWTEPGAWAVAPGVHRIPLPLPMDGLRAVNVYAIETDDGLTLVDGGWAIDVSRTQLEKSLTEIDREVGDIRRFLVTHVHRDHYTQAVTIRREVGSHVSLGLGDKATLDLHPRPGPGRADPHVALLERGRRRRLARAWGEFTRTHTPGPVGCGTTPTPGWRATSRLEVGDRTLDAVHTPGHTRGHYVFADRDAVAALRRRPRAAHDHPVDRLRAGGRALAAGRLPGLADQGPRAAGPHPAARPTGRSRRPRTRGSTSCSPTTSTGSSCAWPRSATVRCRRTTSRASCRGPATSTPCASLDLFNSGAGDAGDPRPPRAAGRPRRPRARRGGRGGRLPAQPSARERRRPRRTPDRSPRSRTTRRTPVSPVCASRRTSRSPTSAIAASISARASPRPRADAATTTRPMRACVAVVEHPQAADQRVVVVGQHVPRGRLEVAAVEVGVGASPARPRRPAGAAATASYAVRASRSSKAAPRSSSGRNSTTWRNARRASGRNGSIP